MMDNEWKSITTAKVHNNRRVRVPPDIRENVVTEDQFKGEVVHWNYDNHAHVIVVSEGELQGDRYDSPGSSTVHQNQNTVTPPAALVDVVVEEFERFDPDDLFGKGSTVVYLATSGLLDGENVSYYLLSSQRFFGMLDENPESNDALGPVLKSADLS